MAERRYAKRCANCGQRAFALAPVEYPIDLAYEGRSLRLVLPGLDVPRCGACGTIVLDLAASRAIDRAVRWHLGLLTPEQLQEYRLDRGLTEDELAEAVHARVADYRLWEDGEQLQPREMDWRLRAFLQVPGGRRLPVVTVEDVAARMPTAGEPPILPGLPTDVGSP